MHKRTILYRGNLKNCNYSCSYCPFAKHKQLSSEMEKDRLNFDRFCSSVAGRARDYSIGAVFVTPYGEASIHRWYWEGLSRLAEIPEIDRVGMQTNLSFSVEECLQVFDSYGGELPEADSCGEKYLKIPSSGENFPGAVPFGENNLESSSFEENDALQKNSEKNSSEKKRRKLSIWATFHPEMTRVDEFVSKCHKLIQNNIMVCAGAVGVPENIQLIRELREKLSPSVYLWINKMDGLKRNYTPDEIDAFIQIDPFFEYELMNPDAAVQMCADRCFVEADGKIHTCNISRTKSVNWYDGSEEEIFEPVCSRKRCTCYLAYGGRADFSLKNIFGDYPVYRIPGKFKAVVFDLDGTLIPSGEETDAPYVQISDSARRKLITLGEMCPVFLATSMPEADVKKILKDDMGLFQGFIFASGGYLSLKEENGSRDKVYSIDTGSLAEAMEFGEKVKARCAVYAKKDTVYKVTLIKGHRRVWKDAECDRIAELLEGSGCRFFTEKNCLEIISRDRDKGTGIEEICSWLEISAGDVLAVGNDTEDDAMKRVCGAYLHAGSRHGNNSQNQKDAQKAHK